MVRINIELPNVINARLYEQGLGWGTKKQATIVKILSGYFKLDPVDEVKEAKPKTEDKLLYLEGEPGPGDPDFMVKTVDEIAHERKLKAAEDEKDV